MCEWVRVCAAVVATAGDSCRAAAWERRMAAAPERQGSAVCGRAGACVRGCGGGGACGPPMSTTWLADTRLTPSDAALSDTSMTATSGRREKSSIACCRAAPGQRRWRRAAGQLSTQGSRGQGGGQAGRACRAARCGVQQDTCERVHAARSCLVMSCSGGHARRCSPAALTLDVHCAVQPPELEPATGGTARQAGGSGSGRQAACMRGQAGPSGSALARGKRAGAATPLCTASCCPAAACLPWRQLAQPTAGSRRLTPPAAAAPLPGLAWRSTG